MSYNKDIAIMNSRLKKLKKEAKNSNLTYKIDQIIKGTAGYYIIFANRLIFKSVKFNNEALDDISEVIKGNINLTDTNYFTQTNIKDIKNDISTIEIVNLYPEYIGIRNVKDGSGNDIVVGVKPGSLDDITNSIINEDKVYIKKANHIYNKDDSVHLLNTVSSKVSEAELEMLSKFLNTPTLDIDDHINTNFANDNRETTQDLIAYKNIELYEEPIIYGDYTYKQYKIIDINDTEWFLVYQIKNSDSNNIKTVYLENANAFIDPLMGLGILICNYKKIKYPDTSYKTLVINNAGNICEHTITKITSKLFSSANYNQFSITFNGTTVYKIYKIYTFAFTPLCIYTNNEYQLTPITLTNNNVDYILFINPKLIENIASYSEKETIFVYSDSNGNSSTSKFNNIINANRSELLRFQLGLQISNTSALYLIYCLNKTVINETTLQNGFIQSTVPGKFTKFAPTEGKSSSYCAWTPDSSNFNSSKTSFKAYIFDDTTTNKHECTFSSIESAIYDSTHYIRQYKASVKITSTSTTLTLFSLIYNNITYRLGVTGYMMYYAPGNDGVVHVLRRILVDDSTYESKVSVYFLRSGDIINDKKFKCNFTVQVDSTFKYAFIQHDCNYTDFNNAGYDNPSEVDEGHAKTKLEYIAYRYIGTDSYTLYRHDSGLSYKIGVDGDNNVVFYYNRYSNWLHCIYQGGIETINVGVQNITSIYDGLPSGQTAYRVKWTYFNKSYDVICIYNSKDELVSTEALPALYPFTINNTTFYASTANKAIYEISSSKFKKYTDVDYTNITNAYDTSTSGEKYIVKWDKKSGPSYTYKGIMKFQTNGNFASFTTCIKFGTV